MSVWQCAPSASVLCGSEGELVSVSISVDPRDLDPGGAERMAGCIAPRFVSALVIVLATLGPALPVAAQTEQRVTICQATGSTANPWVFTTIDARDLPEHLGRGDYRANSIADCPGASARSPAGPTKRTSPATEATVGVSAGRVRLIKKTADSPANTKNTAAHANARNTGFLRRGTGRSAETIGGAELCGCA